MGRVAGVGTFRMSLAVWPELEPQHPLRSNATSSVKLSLNGLQPNLKLNEPSFHPAALALCLYYVDFICLLFRQLLALDFQLLQGKPRVVPIFIFPSTLLTYTRNLEVKTD